MRTRARRVYGTTTASFHNIRDIGEYLGVVVGQDLKHLRILARFRADAGYLHEKLNTGSLESARIPKS